MKKALLLRAALLQSSTYFMRRRLLVIPAAIVLLLVAGLFNFLVGYEVHFFLPYFLPIALLSWYQSRVCAVLIAGGCALMWAAVDLILEHPYSSPFSGFANASFRFGSFLVVAWLVEVVRLSRERQVHLNEQLHTTVLELEQSLTRIKDLQGQRQVICAWTHRIQSEGRWMRFEEFMQRNFQLCFTHGISEEAVKELRNEMAAKD